MRSIETPNKAKHVPVLAQMTAKDQTAKGAESLVAKASVDLEDDRIDDIEDVRSYIGDYFASIEKDPPDTRYQMGYRDAHVELRRLLNRGGRSSRRA